MQKDLQFIKTRANFIRHSFIEEMEKHLLAFESFISSKHIKVQWIVDEEELGETLLSNLPKKHFNKVSFDLPKIPEIILKNNSLVKIVSINDFENSGEIADLLVVEADFGIVETGSVVLIDKKSKNIFNKVSNLVIILDINKLLIRQNDLDTILYLKYIKQQPIPFPNDIKIISSPIQRIIKEAFHSSFNSSYSKENVNIEVYLYDNGKTKILENNFLREALYCIDCGNCKSVCPVYNITNKFSPIDLIKNNCQTENLRNQNIFQNTTMCGNCNEVCPVQIPFTDLLIAEMELANGKSYRENSNDLMKVFSKRNKMNKKSNQIGRYLFIRKYFSKNKKLYKYFLDQKDPFFNILHSAPKTNQ
jgi:L-lactate utilization protein LutB